MSKHLWNLLIFSFRKNNFFTRKKPTVETILVAITDSSDLYCFDLYLINIFMKSMTSERCKDIMFKLTLCLSVTVEDLNLQWRYKYFRHMLFHSPRFYLGCMAGAPQQRAPNFPCPVCLPSHYYVKVQLHELVIFIRCTLWSRIIHFSHCYFSRPKLDSKAIPNSDMASCNMIKMSLIYFNFHQDLLIKKFNNLTYSVGNMKSFAFQK